MSKTLKRCPFCGSKPRFSASDDDYCAFVICTNDRCSARIYLPQDGQAIEAWNNRVEAKDGKG